MIAKLQTEDSWVTGKKITTANPLSLRDGVMINYFQEYTQYWKRFLASVRLISISRASEQDVSLDIALIRTLVSENSPLRNLVNRAARETTLAANKGAREVTRFTNDRKSFDTSGKTNKGGC